MSPDSTGDHPSYDVAFIPPPPRPPGSSSLRLTEARVREIQVRLTREQFSRAGVIPNFTAGSDEFQRKVIEDRDPAIRIVAPAGAGKTQTLINRMLSLVDDGTASPGRLLLLTFDKNAVDSARQKLDEAGGDALDPRPYILTLNAFGLKILKRLFKNEVLTLAAESSFKNKIIREKLKVLRSDAELRDLLPDNLETRVFADAFSVFKNQLFDPRSFDRDELAYFILGARQTQAFLPTAEELGEVVTEERLKASADALIWLYEQVEYEMLHSGHMDFDDQKLRAWVGLSRDAEKRKRVQKFYQEIIVDEFQDLNRLDFELIKLVSAHTRLTVTGYDDQAVYGFRGSDADYLIDLQNQRWRRCNCGRRWSQAAHSSRNGPPGACAPISTGFGGRTSPPSRPASVKAGTSSRRCTARGFRRSSPACVWMNSKKACGK